MHKEEEMTTVSTRPPLEIRRTLLSKLMSPHNHRTDRPRYKDAPSSGRAVIPTVENQGMPVLQLNAEGLTNAKLEVIHQLADSNQVAVVLLKETHRTTDDNLKLPEFLLAGSILSKHHGMATFVRTGITWSAVKRYPPDSNSEWLVTEVQETTIVNVYKPPPSELYPTSLPSVPAPAIYAGDFNCQHTQTGIINRLQRTVRRSATGHPVPKQCYCMTQRRPRASSLHGGTHTSTRTLHSPWAVAATQSQNDASLIDSSGHTIGCRSSKCHR